MSSPLMRALLRLYPRRVRKRYGDELLDLQDELSAHAGVSRARLIQDMVAGALVVRRVRSVWLAISVALMIAVIVVLGVALGSVGSRLGVANTPGPVARVPVAWVRSQQRAIVRVASGDHACRAYGRSSPGAKQMLDQAPPTQFRSLLSVLDHPAVAGARMSVATIRHVAVDVQGVYIRYARRGVSGDITYYLIPAAHVGQSILPASCYAKQLKAFQSQIRGLPVPERESALVWERRMTRTREAGGLPGVELITTGDGGTGGQIFTVDELRTDPWVGAGSGGNNNVTQTALVVPDDVATVTASYSTQTYPGRVTRPLTVTRPAVNNLVAFVYHGAWDPPKLTYRSASGAVLWSTPTR
jgi:hypothetical protein